jgi:hypothetical protein
VEKCPTKVLKIVEKQIIGTRDQGLSLSL